jgi:hypothetical protein
MSAYHKNHFRRCRFIEHTADSSAKKASTYTPIEDSVGARAVEWMGGVPLWSPVGLGGAFLSFIDAIQFYLGNLGMP